MRRLSRKEKLRESVRQLDAFPKVLPDADIQRTSTTGAVATFISASLIVFLVLSEISYYRTVDIVYEHVIDTQLQRHINLTLDMTVAMDCKHLGVDYVDVAGKSLDATAYMTLEPAHFQLSPNQVEYIETFARIKAEEGSRGMDSLNRFLHGSMREPMPTAAPEIDSPPDGCRIHGKMALGKVMSNFHVTAGKSLHHSMGHSHMSNNVPKEAYNFSHRIDRFSFSEEHYGAMALDGDLKVTEEARQAYQYFLDVVPSLTQRLGQSTPFRSNQYSVRELHRVLGQRAKTNPGIFFRIDLEPIGVLVKEQRRSLLQFLVRLCGIVGGIFATSGMLSRMIGALISKLSGAAADAVPAAVKTGNSK